MLRYTVSSEGNVIYIIDIYNDGTGTKRSGNYGLRVRENGFIIYEKQWAVYNFKRLSKSAWDLLYMALVNTRISEQIFPLPIGNYTVQCDLHSAISYKENKSLGTLNLVTGTWKPARRKSFKPVSINSNDNLVSYLKRNLERYLNRGRLTE